MDAPHKISATRLWLVMMKSYGAMKAFAESSITGTGLGLSDFMVLEMLLHKGPMAMSAIAQKVRLANASVTAAIDRLETRGLVRRTFHKTDRRVRTVELTAEGTKLIRTTFAQHVKDLDRLMHELSSEDRYRLYEGLKQLGTLAAAAHAEDETK